MMSLVAILVMHVIVSVVVMASSPSVRLVHPATVVVIVALVPALVYHGHDWHNHMVLNPLVSLDKLIVSDFSSSRLVEKLWLGRQLCQILLLDDFLQNVVCRARVLRNVNHFLVKCFLLPVVDYQLLLLLLHQKLLKFI